MRAALPLGLAAMLALAVGLASSSVDDIYRARVEAELDPTIGTQQESRVLRLAPGTARPRNAEEAPFLPTGAAGMDAVARGVAGRVDGTSPREVRERTTVIDTGIAPIFRERFDRRLAVTTEQRERELASAVVRTFVPEFADQRDRWYGREFGKVERALRRRLAGARGRLRVNLSERLEATRIARRLAVGIVGAVRPNDVSVKRVAPSPLRDALVAALVGALAGALLPALARHRPRHRAATFDRSR